MLFADFYESELPGQLRSATLILGSRAAAADVVHDAFVQVFQSWDEIEEPGPYLQRMVVNRCRDIQPDHNLCHRRDAPLYRECRHGDDRRSKLPAGQVERIPDARDHD